MLPLSPSSLLPPSSPLPPPPSLPGAPLSAGGGEEQAAAAAVCSLLCVQLGGGPEGEEGFKVLRPILSAILIDDSASLSARQSVSDVKVEAQQGCTVTIS